MQLHIYNTLTRQKELFVPLMDDLNYKWPKKDFVGFYSCGPTVYGMPHFGNVRASFTADLIRNVLKNIMWYKTISVTNFTDVGHLAGDSDDGEEKMEKAAKKEWITSRDLAKKYEQIYRDFFKWMQIDEFDVMPRATEHITEQIDLVKKLEAEWYTYIIPGDGVYMDTSKINDYGKLLGPNYKKHLEGIQGWERVELWWKKNITDFALRKLHVGDGKRDMEWESPRGIWFPGRHAECSAMSSKYLGNQFDIHHGGYDLIPIHHTNEIAQSECAFGVNPRVKYRMHNQFVNMNGKKMSKSDGNIVSPYEVLEKWYDYLDIRYFFFTTHYRSFFDFTRQSMEAAKTARQHLIKKIGDDITTAQLFAKEKSFVAIEKKLKTDEGKKFRTEIGESICDDLNTPKLIATINTYLSNMNDEIRSILYRLEDNFLKIWLFETIVEEKFDIPDEVTALANQRLQAKKDKNFALADELRNKIAALWFQVKDTKDGYEITKN